MRYGCDTNIYVLLPSVTYHCVVFIRRTFLIFFKIWARMEKALRWVADKIRTVTFSADVIRIVPEWADSCGRALRTIRRVRKCVCDWGISILSLVTNLQTHKLMPPQQDKAMMNFPGSYFRCKLRCKSTPRNNTEGLPLSVFESADLVC